MKKFSKITNQKIGKDPVIKEEISEIDLFKSSVIFLIENLLSIETYGPIDRYLRAGSIKIAGKDLLIEALIDLINDKSLKDKHKILEGLKSKISDFSVIEEDLNETNVQINESSNKGKMLSHKSKLISIYKLYKDDTDLLYKQVEESAKKIKDGKKAFWRGLTAENMASEGKFPRSVFKKISDIYFFRSKQLGYRK